MNQPTLLLAFALRDLLLPAGLALVCLALWQFVRQRQAPPTPGSSQADGVRHALTPHEKLERDRQIKGAGSDLHKLAAQIEATTRRCGEELDEKISRLEALLEQADERIADLHKLSAPKQDAPPRDPPGRGDEEPPASLPSASIESEDPLARSVYRLADRGVPPAQIARQLHEHVGKVELILALRQA